MPLTYSWTEITDAATDADSIIDQALMQGIAHDLIHLREWMGASYYAGAAPDHDHDGVNSKAIVGASLVLLETKIASASPSIDFITGIDATHNTYMCVLSRVTPDTNGAVLGARFSIDGGATWFVGGTDYVSVRQGFGSDGLRYDDSLNNTGYAAVGPAQGTSATAGSGGINGTIYVHNSQNADVNKSISAHGNVNGTLAFLTFQSTAIDANASLKAGTVNGFRLFFSSGNIASGTVSLYGIAK